MKMTTTGWWMIGVVSVLGLGLGGYFLFKHKSKPSGNRKLSERLGTSGIRTVKAGQHQRLVEPDWNHPFDMNYEQDVKTWVAPTSILTLNPTDGAAYAKALKQAKGTGWLGNDDEDAVGAVFSKKLKDKVQVAGLSRAFWNRYKMDMWQYLRSFLSNSEMKKYVHDPVRRLPNYRIANGKL